VTGHSEATAIALTESALGGAVWKIDVGNTSEIATFSREIGKSWFPLR
jgi:hypothetical protein